MAEQRRQQQAQAARLQAAAAEQARRAAEVEQMRRAEARRRELAEIARRKEAARRRAVEKAIRAAEEEARRRAAEEAARRAEEKARFHEHQRRQERRRLRALSRDAPNPSRAVILPVQSPVTTYLQPPRGYAARSALGVGPSPVRLPGGRGGTLGQIAGRRGACIGDDLGSSEWDSDGDDGAAPLSGGREALLAVRPSPRCDSRPPLPPGPCRPTRSPARALQIRGYRARIGCRILWRWRCQCA